jgi:hypothetical protein
MLKWAIDRNNADDALELHASCQATPWFMEYLMSSDVLDNLLQLVPLADFCNPQVTSLIFIIFFHLVESTQPWGDILAGAYRNISSYEDCSRLAHLDGISAVFEDFLRLKPESLLDAEDTSSHQRLSDVKHVIPSRGVQANRAYSLLLWKGGNPGAMLDRDGPYSCSATWSL